MGTAVGRAVDLARLGVDAARARNGGPEATRRVVDRLAALRGLPRKVGQIVALGELGDGAGPFTPLTEGGPSLDAGAAERAVESALGRPLAGVFRTFDRHGVGASLGQVHRATLHDGREVAVKLRLPGVAETIEHDLGALDWLTWPFGGMRGFDLAAYRGTIGATLRRELDYQVEARSIERFAAAAAGIPGLEVPAVVPEFTSDGLLVMTWLRGESFPVTRGWSPGTRIAAGRTLLRLFLRTALGTGFLHADPHPGNVRFRSEEGRPVVGLLDFGCMAELAPSERTALAWLLRDALAPAGAPGDHLAAYRALGFRPELLEPMADRLPALSAALFAPFAARTGVPAGPTVAEVLGDWRMNFRAAGPPRLIYLIRAWHGTAAYLSALDAPFGWRDVVEEELTALPAGGVAAPGWPEGALPPGAAAHLRIRVAEGARTRVSLTFASRCAENMGEILPDEVARRVADAGIDVPALAARAVASGFAPAALFEWRDGEKTVTVWLE